MKGNRLALRARCGLLLMVLASGGTAFTAQTAQAAPDQGPARSQPQSSGGGEPATLSRALGDRSYDKVAQLQRDLVSGGLSPGPVDGVYGPHTEQAVTRYQQQNGLTADGVAGAITLNQLRYGGSNGVVRLQGDLAREGVDPGPADGLYGPKTETAIARFEQQGGVMEDAAGDTQIVGKGRLVATAVPQPHPPPPPAQAAGNARALQPQAPGSPDFRLIAAMAAAGSALAIFAAGWILFQRIERHLEAESRRASEAVWTTHAGHTNAGGAVSNSATFTVEWGSPGTATGQGVGNGRLTANPRERNDR